MEMKKPKMEVIEIEEDDVEEERSKKCPSMKAEQYLEFKMQALVYSYIEAGLNVPPHLVVPIWKSLALSSSSSSSAAFNYLIHLSNHSSSSSSPSSYPIHLTNHSSLMSVGKEELEPTRCRRTDGKKWRCSNTVLPSEKYCERHMHRGRKRSRKLVESSSSYDVAASPTKHENTHGLDSNNESHGTVPVSSNAQVVTIASFPSARVSESVTRPPLVISESTHKSASHGARSKNYMNMSYDDFIKQRDSSTHSRIRIPVAGDDDKVPSVQKLFPEVSDVSLEAARVSSNRKNDIIARGREWKNMNANGGFFPGIHFSPDTVLQDRGLHRVETDEKPGRCRRTDGKKWRCAKDVLSGEKYCDKHMNRGVRKKHPVDTNKSIDSAGFSPITMKPAATSATCDDGHAQKLSVSIMGIPLYRIPDEKVTSSCSTDTTVTDTNLMGKEDYEEILSLCSSGV